MAASPSNNIFQLNAHRHQAHAHPHDHAHTTMPTNMWLPTDPCCLPSPPCCLPSPPSRDHCEQSDRCKIPMQYHQHSPTVSTVPPHINYASKHGDITSNTKRHKAARQTHGATHSTAQHSTPPAVQTHSGPINHCRIRPQRLRLVSNRWCHHCGIPTLSTAP